MAKERPEELLKLGKLPECLQELQDRVRKDPADAKLRVFLFQLLCVTGDWDRALNQLKVASEMDPSCALMAAMYQPAVHCEALRSEILAGKRSPVIFGKPEEWMVWMIQACQLEGAGRATEAGALRERAFQAAPATGGKINGQDFEWIADADTRLGPMIEAIINGALYWVPYCRIHAIQIEEPADLRDMVWIPSRVVWTNGGEALALLPVRYPGSESAEDGAVRLARRTDWIDAGEGIQRGLGQRLLATDAEDFPLLSVRSVEMDNEVEPGKGPQDAGPQMSVELTGG